MNRLSKFGCKHSGLVAGLSLIIVLAALNSLLELTEERQLKSIKKGESDLYCLFTDGARKVDKALVVGWEDGEWKFGNGHASSCWVVSHKRLN